MQDVDPETVRRNNALGWFLFGVFLVLLAGVVVVAVIYLAVA
ncbi:MAG TPA: hypothetical protein VM290_05700 [Gaiellaceae bacterium]|nr:hypothetical protein [Gaiellaceae bacterium]